MTISACGDNTMSQDGRSIITCDDIKINYRSQNPRRRYSCWISHGKATHHLLLAPEKKK
jgi:hypothetical protein